MKLASKQIQQPERLSGHYTLAPGVGLLGLDATGTTDMTSVFNAVISALPAGSTLKVWPGVYKLTTGTIQIAADRITLDFTGATTNFTLPAGTNWATTGFNFLIRADGRTDTTIRGGKWVCAGDPTVGAGQGKNAYKARVFGAHPAFNTTLDSMTCEGCTLSRIVSGNNATIIRPNGKNTEAGINYQQGGTESFILFPLTSNWRVTEPTIDGYGHGVHFDGGDAAVSGVDVPITTARGLTHGRVIGGDIRNCSGGGVWGGMAKDVIVSFAGVDNCGDVGIDFEGCIDCKSLNNNVSNCGHNSGAGCLAAFSIGSGIVFEGGTVSISLADHKLVGLLSNATASASTWPVDVTIRGITFINNQAGTLRFVQPSSHYQRVAVQDCTFINCGLSWSTVLSYTQAIENNKFFVTDTTLTPQSFSVLSVGSVRGTSTLPGSLVVRNNRIRCAVQANVGITLFSNDGAFAVEEVIEGNRIRNCNIDFNPKFTVANASVAPVRYIRFNSWGNGNIFPNEPATGPQSVNIQDLNRDGSGALYPAGSGGGGGSTDTEAVQDIAGAMLTGGTHTGLSATYNDTAGTIDLSVSGAVFVPNYLRVYNAAWMTTDNSAMNGASVLTTGQSQLFELYVDQSMSGTLRMLYEVSAQGTTLTANGSTIKNGFVLLNASGDYMAHADCISDWGSTGMKRTVMNQSVTLTVGTKYYVQLISTGSTPVALRVTENLSGKASVNAGRASAPYIYSTKTVDGITSGTLDLTTGWTAKATNRPWIGIGGTA